MAENNQAIFLRGLWNDNPTLRQLLGMCPTLAVSNTVINSVSMGLATTFVLVCSGALVSMLRRFIPKEIRIAGFILIIATFVTIVDYIIQAVSLDVHRALGPFIALIVVNCIILGRAEAFASKNAVGASMADALGMGLGFTFSIFCMGTLREIFGNGTFAGIPLFGKAFQPMVIFVMPAGGFIVLGCLLLAVAAIRRRTEARSAAGRGR